MHRLEKIFLISSFTIYLVFGFVLFSGFKYQEPDTEQAEELEISGDCPEVRTFIFDGHQYFYFDDKCIIHDPECEERDFLLMIQNQHSH